MSRNQTVENFTTVLADHQTQGRGQMNSKWVSKTGENLLMTTYVNLQGLSVNLMPVVSCVVALSLHKTILNFLPDIPGLKIKWPNDILSYNSKMAGVLVENSVRKNEVYDVFVGVGLNVNQKEFSESLNKATSMSLVGDVTFEIEAIANAFVMSLEKVLNKTYIENNVKKIKQEYLANLYKFNTPAMFIDVLGNQFMGKIIDVDSQGKLILEKEDELQYAYEIKQIAFV